MIVMNLETRTTTVHKLRIFLVEKYKLNFFVSLSRVVELTWLTKTKTKAGVGGLQSPQNILDIMVPKYILPCHKKRIIVQYL